MKKYLNIIILLMLAVFLAGSAVIVYTGRPVFLMDDDDDDDDYKIADQQKTETSVNNEPSGNNSKGYSMDEVAVHNNQNDCWSVVSRGVYDLTSWISRHPGGPEAIIGMCGLNGTDLYTGQHGSSKRPASALFLLKIGNLK